MIRGFMLVPAIFALLLTPVAIAADGTDSSATANVIDRLGLAPAPYPISTHPRWQPSRVVVSLPPQLGNNMPGYLLELQEAAGDATLVVDTSGAFVPTAETLARADAYIGFCTTDMLANADKSLVWVHSYTVGMDRCSNADEALLGDRVFTNNKRLSGPTIAEHSIAMLLSISRGLPAYTAAQARSEWRPELAAQLEFGELGGKTMLIAGLGGIGTEIARRAHGLGMKVIATRHSSREGPDFVSYVGLSHELETLAARADVVVNSLPLTEQTRGLFDKAFFATVKPGAIFISVGRGQSTVTADLVAALASGHLYGAGLDVTDPEPLPADSPLWLLPNVIITPHVSAAGGASLQRTALIATENLRRYVSGEALLNLVDMAEGY